MFLIIMSEIVAQPKRFFYRLLYVHKMSTGVLQKVFLYQRLKLTVKKCVYQEYFFVSPPNFRLGCFVEHALRVAFTNKVISSEICTQN